MSTFTANNMDEVKNLVPQLLQMTRHGASVRVEVEGRAYVLTGEPDRTPSEEQPKKLGAWCRDRFGGRDLEPIDFERSKDLPRPADFS